MRTVIVTVLCSTFLAAAASTDWVARSNENAAVLLNVDAKYTPESAGEIGVTGLDERISLPSVNSPQEHAADLQAAVATLKKRLSAESDARVHQDLEILIDAAGRESRSLQVRDTRALSYMNVPRMIFGGMRSLLNPQISPERQKAAVVRLRRYTGVEQGYTSTFARAEQIFRAKQQNASLIGPPKVEVEKDLATMDAYVDGIADLLKKFNQQGYEQSLDRLRAEVKEYKEFVRTDVLPRARSDFRLPPELYALDLANAGVDYTPAELEQLAHQSFSEIQSQMQELAPKIAQAHGFTSTDYRDVIRELKKQQVDGNAVMPLYHDTLANIEEIIRREHLITLPSRPCIISIASAAETAQQPAPHYLSPPLIGNHGEQGQFVLPGGTTGENGEDLKYDDFTFKAAAWTLTAHEARPGHDLQFAAMVERGVSQARAIYAFNSTNVEGWALYAEWFMLPYMPDDGKLISLQFRLLRAARAFLDPELQEGKVTPEQAMTTLQNDVMLSKAFATEEVDRFTFRMPGQAVSYFDGYTRLLELRSAIEKATGTKFNVQHFHDYILSQGMLPPRLLRRAVTEEFAKKQ